MAAVPTSAGPAALLHHPDAATRGRRARARSAGRSPERLPADRPARSRCAPPTGRSKRAGVDVVHFPFQDAFTDGASPASTSRTTCSTSICPSSSAPLARRAAGDRSTAPIASGPRGRGDDLLGPAGLDRAATASPRRRSGSCPGPRCCSSTPSPSAEDLEGIRARGSRCPAAFLLYPAQPWPHKNHERLLEALALVRDRTGDGDPAGLLRAPRPAISASGPRIAPGARPRGDDAVPGLRLPAWSCAASTSWPRRSSFPSRFEGWGLPVCEAFSAGLPVASLDRDRPARPGRRRRACSSIPESTEQIAEAVQRLWADEGLRADLAERGQASAASSSAGTAPRACSAPTTGGSAGGALQRKTVSFWRLRLPPERRHFPPTWTLDLTTRAPSPRCSARSSAVLAALQAPARQRLPGRLPRPARRHRPADRAARLGIGRGGDPPRQRGARPRRAASPRSSGSWPRCASCSSAGERSAGEDDEPSRPGLAPAEMATRSGVRLARCPGDPERWSRRARDRPLRHRARSAPCSTLAPET